MPFEEVTIGDCRLIRADCMDVLPTLGIVDAVVTDPPYGLGDKWAGGGGGKLSSWNFNPSEAQSWDGDTAEGVEDAYGKGTFFDETKKREPDLFSDTVAAPACP